VAALDPPPALDPPVGLDSLAALVAYEGVARALITAVKYRNSRAPIHELAPALASLVAPDLRGAVVTWAPTTRARARHRGFDQAELLARAVAQPLGSPVRRCLIRRAGAHQTGRGADERRSGPRFVATGAAPRSVLLVDDVCTTGATLSAAAEALRDVGAASVHALVLARTPARKARR
jgi:predicted amidophosphoribosyltransferase